MRTRVVIGAVLGAALCAPAAFAVDKGFNANNFYPTVDPFGYVTVAGARSLRTGKLHAKAVFNWANDPLEFPGGKLIDDWTFVHLIAGFGLLEIGNGGLSLGVDVPLVLDNDGNELFSGERIDEFEISDVRAEAKLVLMDREDDAIGIFARGFIEFPAGSVREFVSTLQDRPTVNLFAGLEKQLGPLRLGIEVGWTWIEGKIELPGVTIDDKLHLRAGVGLTPFPNDLADLEIVFEVHHWARLSNLYEEEFESPVELGGGIKYTGFIDLMVGGSTGVDRGVGAPDGRFFFSLGVNL
ncbi:MAG: hypothetical protein KatS3mg102_1577 [Planctomycetota bacterium]|nr:MAG: hypothetical protein KatS3mg102_1577 [Planctomycetota bacterium]